MGIGASQNNKINSAPNYAKKNLRVSQDNIQIKEIKSTNINILSVNIHTHKYVNIYV